MNVSISLVSQVAHLASLARHLVSQGVPQKIRDTYVMRRTKQDVDHRLELPPCDFQNVELELFPEERAFYKEVYTSAQKRFKVSTGDQRSRS